ncbi:MAG: magnesium-translocating P-type ATPase [Chitinophagales bacterium]|nr:magnesium-translocating P-type ATPase [Chitinophagales bacterium]MBP9189372.1 magnesium-translocating P-type ATPase [Chitinophagales bacterium]MBP9548410.1 magnesium-translocating P-type ATPase [Chitinophagales bacterium]MBP9703460.1 magnesium-translocating P-type ATPase [Chitinophagales bacterium]
MKKTSFKTISKSQRLGMSSADIEFLRNAASMDSPAVYDLMESDEKGLSQEEAEDRILKFGLNEVDYDRSPSWVKQLIKSFVNPFILILLSIVIISYIMDVWLVVQGEKDYKTVLVISIMVLISGLLSFFQEYRSNRAAEQLKNMVKTTAAVLRKYVGRNELDMKMLVPGDVVYLSAGDMIPADCRIVQSIDLFIGQSMLTGESLPIEKSANAISEIGNKPVIELNNLCFMGTTVESGAATAVVITTGSSTYFGSIGRSLVGENPATSFDLGINKVSTLLIRFMLIMVPVIFLVNGLVKGDWMEALLFSIAVAVGLTPEMLPVIVTANLAKGALSMSKQKVIVKRLNAIQNIGAMDMLCTDKTGTLTLDKIVLEQHLNVFGVEDDEVLKWAYLNSYHQTGLVNLMDKAVLEHVELNDYLKVKEYYQKVDEIPFDFQRRRMSIILKQKNNTHLLICKGAVEEMLSLCTHSFNPGEDRQLHIKRDEIIQITSEMRAGVLETANKLNEKGLRILLLAIREFDGDHPLNYGVADESNLIFTGFIGFLDPAKPSAKPSIAALRKLNVPVKVLTGDNDTVTKKICTDVGIPIQNIILGDELDLISDEELTARVDDISIFAKMSPLQKVRIVKSLKAKGHTVGFLGDGINDAPALKEADVGITVDTAVDIAKESSDIILLEKDLMVLKKGVEYGRQTFGNIIKYIKMATSSNFGNVFSILGASAFLPFLPMLPIQILVQNLLYSVSQTSIPWDKMDTDYLEKPKKWDASGIRKFMIYIGPTSSIFDYILFAVMFFIFKANNPEHQSLFQTGWFVEGLLSQTLIVHMIRTKKIPFIQSWASAPVIALTSLIMIIGIIIPFTPLAEILYMQPLPLAYFPWLLGILTAYCLLIQYMKNWYIRKFNQWL